MSITDPVTDPRQVTARLTQAGVSVLGKHHLWALDSGDLVHEYGKFLLIKGGSARLEGCLACDLEPGDLVLLDVGQVHRLIDREPLELFIFFCDPGRIPLWRKLMASCGPAHHARLGMEAIRPLRRRLCELSRECLATDDWAHTQQRTLAGDLLATIDRCLSETQRMQNWPDDIRAAVTFIDRHCHQPLSVAGIARHCDLPYRTLTDRFRRFVGTTCKGYMTRRRIDRAQELLSEGKQILSVTTETGFGDLSQFYRAFKQQVGTSPGRWLQTQDLARTPEPISDKRQ